MKEHAEYYYGLAYLLRVACSVQWNEPGRREKQGIFTTSSARYFGLSTFAQLI